MTNYLDLLAKAAEKTNTLPAASAEKQNQLMQGVDMYQAAATRSNGLGSQSRSELEQDLQTLSPQELSYKYGEDASALSFNYGNASNQVFADRSAEGFNATDMLAATALGLGNTLGGVATLGGLAVDVAGEATGLGNPQLATKIGAGVQFLSDGYEDMLLSDGMKASRRLKQADSAASARDNKAQFDADIAAGENSVIAGGKRIVRGIVDGIANTVTDPTRTADLAATAVGSVLATPVLTSQLNKIGKDVLVTASKKGASLETLERLQKIGKALAVPAAIGLMEGGGAVKDISLEIDAMKHEDLIKTSPEYVSLVQENINQGMPEMQAREAAKASLSTEAALIGGGIGAVTGAAFGKLVSKFEGKNPLTLNPGEALKRTGLQTAEEGGQGGAGTTGQNFAMQSTVDESQQLTEGVGEGIGEGALAGSLASGVTETVSAAPSLAAKGAAKGIIETISAVQRAGKGVAHLASVAKEAADEFTQSETGTKIKEGFTNAANNIKGSEVFTQMGEKLKPVGDAVTSAKDKLKAKIDALDARNQAKRDEKSPTNDKVVLEEATELAGAVDQVVEVTNQAIDDIPEATDEQKAAAKDKVSRLTSALNFSVDEEEGMDPRIKKILGGVTNRVEAVQRLAGFIISEGTPEAGKEFLAAEFLKMVQPLMEADINQDGALDLADTDSPLIELVTRYKAIRANIMQSPSAMRAMEAARNSLVQAAETQDLTIADSEIGTQAAVDKANQLAATAQVAPEKVNVEAAKRLLFQNKQGSVGLTLAQQLVVEAAVALNESIQEGQTKGEKTGISEEAVKVSKMIMSDIDGEGSKKSLTSHVMGVVTALAAGNTEGAKELLQDLGYFVQHMTNKVNALNEHLANPQQKNVPYLALVPNSSGQFVQTERSFSFVDTNSIKSIRMAQIIGMEAEVVANIYNKLVVSMPQLGLQPMPVPQLDSLLNDSAEVVKAEFKSGVRQVTPTQTNATAEPVNEAPTTSRVERRQAIQARVAKLSDARLEALSAATMAQVMDGDVNAERLLDIIEAEISSRAAEVEAKAKAEEKAKEEEALPKLKEPEPEKVSKPINKTEPVVEEVVQEAVEQDVEVETTGLRAVYPGLMNQGQDPKENNIFISAFNFTGKAISRFAAYGNDVLNEIKRVLGDSEAYANFLGDALKVPLSDAGAEAYADYLGNVESIKDAMNKALNQGVNKGFLKKLLADETMNPQRNRKGRVLALVEKQEDGSYKYNDELIDVAIVAALQEIIQGNQTSKQSGEFIEETLTSDLDRTDMNILLNGMTREVFADSLANRIVRYWGVRAKNDAPIGHSRGVPVSLAFEIGQALISTGFIQEGEALTSDKISVVRWSIDTSKIPEGVLRNANAIERAFAIDPEMAVYLTQDKMPVKDTYVGSKRKITKEQMKALRLAQSTVHKLDTTMLDFYRAIGEDGLVLLMDGFADPNAKYNINELESINSRALAAKRVFETLEAMVSELEAANAKEGKPVTEGGFKFTYGYTSVGRMQMLNSFNPQSNKLMREAVLPTFATLDLNNNPEHIQNFYLAIAQAMGISIHVKGVEASVNQVNEVLNNQLAEVVGSLQKWLSNKEDPTNDAAALITVLKADLEAAGMNFTPAAVHAVIEYARMLNDPATDQFTTSLYIEADGVTNGVVNLISLFSTGKFTNKELANLNAGGVVFGSNGEMSLSTIRSDISGTDIYTRMANSFNKIVSTPSKESAPVFRLLNNLVDVVDSLDETSSPLIGDEAPRLKVGRGFAKKPTTQGSYGASKKGFGAGQLKDVTATFYAMMSRIANKDKDQTAWDAAFPNDPNAAERLSQVFADIEHLSSHMVIAKLDTIEPYPNVTKKDIYINLEDPTQTTLSDFALKNMEAMLGYFVGSAIEQAIQSTLGSGLSQTIKSIAEITNLQSIVYSSAVSNALETAIANKIQKAKESGVPYSPSDLLSQAEIDAVFDSLEPLAASFNTNGNNFQVNKQQRAEMVQSAIESVSSGSQISMLFNAPAPAGVQGIPMLNIGSGDALMILNAITALGTEAPVLQIYDGIHMPLDQANSMSEVINESARKVWETNPMAAVRESLEITLATFDKLTPDTENYVNQVAMLLKDKELVTKEQISRLISEAVTKAKNIERRINERLEAKAKVSISVDQMAAMSKPKFVSNTETTGKEAPSSEEQAALLNKVLDSLVPKEEPTKEEKPVPVKRLSISGLRKLTQGNTLTEGQKTVMKQVLKVFGNQGWTVLRGSRAEMLAYMEKNGIAQNSIPETVGGITDPMNKEIYLFNDSNETLVHELVHATTFQTVYNYFTGEAEISAEAAQAVERIVAMMNDFVDLPLSIDNMKEADALANAQGAIQDALSEGTPEGQAKAVNEFMAWSLANPDIASKLSTVKANPIVLLARKAVMAIKKLFWGRQRVDAPALDVLSNLQFNTSILMREQGNLTTGLSTNIRLPMNNQFGSDQRLADIETKIGNIINKLDAREFIKAQQQNQDGKAGTAQRAGMIGVATAIAAEVNGLGFKMTAQERNVFVSLVSALSAEQTFNSTAMVTMQKLYEHTMKNLDPEMFRKFPGTENVADETIAQTKFNFLAGNLDVFADLEGGATTLLPAFIALAVTNPEFREILSKIDMPKAGKSDADSKVDRALSDGANGLLRALENRMAFGNKKPKDIQKAMDILVQGALEVAESADYLPESRGFMDAANDILIDKIQTLADSVVEMGERLKDSDSNAVRNVGAFTSAIASLLSSTDLNEVNRGIADSMTRLGLGETFINFISDITGRTSANANVYDLIKLVKTESQQTRQTYRDEVPLVIKRQFKKQPSLAQWTSITRGLAKTDLASLSKGYTFDQVKDLISNPAEVSKEMAKIKSKLQALNPAAFKQYMMLSERLAAAMDGNRTHSNTLSNPVAIANLLGQKKPQGTKQATQEMIDLIDNYVSLLALDNLPEMNKAELIALFNNEPKGMEFVYGYLVGLHRDEIARLDTTVARYNYYKGFILPMYQDGVELVVADSKTGNELTAKSYVNLGEYKGSGIFTQGRRSYYFSPVGGKASFNQGIFQNVKPTSSGVDPRTGYTFGIVAGRITEKSLVKKLAATYANTQSSEPLRPIFNADGEIVAFEELMDQSQLQKLEPEQDLSVLMGAWKGRQVEEYKSKLMNRVLINNLAESYAKDIKENPGNEDLYINILDPEQTKNDPVYQYAVSLMSVDSINHAAEVFKSTGVLMVRKDMMKDVLGYPSASIGDAWTGVSRWSDEVQKGIRTILTTVFGDAAYERMVKFEKFTMGLVGEAKTIIAVKSGLIPMLNMAANVIQLLLKGVNIKDIVSGSKVKLMEINAYNERRLRIVDAEAELQVALNKNPTLAKKLTAEIQSLKDANNRMSISDLLNAGEYSALTDLGMTQEELNMSNGKFVTYIEGLIDKLPKGVKTAGRYAYVSKDTALFKGLQKSVQYSDFISKAVLFDHLKKNKGLSTEQALGKITETFVNYDVLPGRTRGALESLGLLWFYNFKLRISKEALTIIRDNPAQALMFAAMSGTGLITSPGSPLEDSVFSKAATDSLGWSIGPGMGLAAPELNPWMNLTH